MLTTNENTINMSEKFNEKKHATFFKQKKCDVVILYALIGFIFGAILQRSCWTIQYNVVPHESPSELASIACGLASKCVDVGKIICNAAGRSCENENSIFNESYGV